MEQTRIDTTLNFRIRMGIALEGGRWFFRDFEFRAEHDASLEELKMQALDMLRSVLGQHDNVIHFWLYDYEVIP